VALQLDAGTQYPRSKTLRLLLKAPRLVSLIDYTRKNWHLRRYL
jgi:hypothetical protein